MSRGNFQKQFSIVMLRLLTNPLFGTTLDLVVCQFVSPLNVKEATAMNLPDGPLAPLPGAETLFRILQSQFRRSDIEGIYSADFIVGPPVSHCVERRPM